jgi:hypothetical protein
MKILLAIFSLLLFVGTASADSVWTYTGNKMTGCNCALDGTVTLDSSGNATAWDFIDGTHELTNLNSTGHVLSTNLFNLGTFFTWSVDLSGNGVEFSSLYFGSAHEATDSVLVNGQLFGLLEGNRGVWSPAVVATPEPATALFVGSGLLLLGLWRRNRRKPLDSDTWDKLA